MTALTLLLLLLLTNNANALIGYDCGSRQLNVTTLSLLDVGDCDLPENTINVTQSYIQLLQINEYLETKVIQCKLEIHRTIYYCGMHSHVSIVLNGENEYIYDISKESCEDIHKTGVFQFGNMRTIHGIRVNNTVTHSITLAGYVNGDGKCDGAGYADPFGSWESVVVQGTLKITLSEHTAQIKLSSNTIHLRSGTTCSLSEGHCIDIEGGYTFWSAIPKESCNFNHYGVLYEGLASKMIDNQIVYSLETQDITFALTAKGTELLCGYKLIKTEHPKLIIFETSRGEGFANKGRVAISNLDIFAYVNSKFVYVEKHIRSQMKLLYRDVVTQRCELEQQTLKTSLSLATQSPDNFAYDLMRSPGYMAVTAGEVVHIVKCVPVEVKVQHGSKCYAELQVTRNNNTYYLTPRTHILKSKGTEIPCNSLLPSYYYIGKAWYKILPHPTEALTPEIIKPKTKVTWNYINPADLATSGIYSEKDLDQLRERIMFPVERPALLNDLAREMRGHPVNDDEKSILKLLNRETVEKIITSTWTYMWGKFMTFGTASAGFIMIMMIFYFIKSAMDMIIRGYTLHTIYGWSIHILGAIWSSLAHLLIHLGSVRTEPDIELGQQRQSQSQPQQQELTPINRASNTTPSAPEQITVDEQPAQDIESQPSNFFDLSRTLRKM